jgi:lipopolysaccharide transport system permease protein
MQSEVTASVPPVAGFRLTGPGTPLRTLLSELWQSRRLIGVLARKDFLVRYRRTRLGLVWVVAVPLVQAAVLAIVFSSVVPRSSDGLGSYAVFVLAGMVPWAFFSSALPAASSAVTDSSNLAQRIYFPRLVLPIVAVVTACYPLVATLAIFLVAALALGPGLQLELLWVLPGTVLVVLLVTGLGLFLSAAQVYVRDLRFAVTAALTVLFYLTPVIYPIQRAPRQAHDVIRALPGAGPVELFHRAVGAADPLMWWSVLASIVWTSVFAAAGLVVHCRRDRVLADLL